MMRLNKGKSSRNVYIYTYIYNIYVYIYIRIYCNIHKLESMVMVGIGWMFGRVRYPWYKGLLSKEKSHKKSADH